MVTIFIFDCVTVRASSRVGKIADFCHEYVEGFGKRAAHAAAPNSSGSIHPGAVLKTIIWRTIIRLFETGIRKIELEKKKN